MECLRKLCFFLRADEYGWCNVLIKGKPVKLDDCDGMQVSCALNFVGQKNLFVFCRRH